MHAHTYIKIPNILQMFLQAVMVPESWNNRESEDLKPVSDIVKELSQGQGNWHHSAK
jgi:uncharacterized protein YfkK (UPF0435 family)